MDKTKEEEIAELNQREIEKGMRAEDKPVPPSQLRRILNTKRDECGGNKMTLEIRALDRKVGPLKILYWGKDFFDIKRKVFSKKGFPDVVDIRIGNSPENKDFELHVLTNEFFRKDMPSCQGEVTLEICTGTDDKGEKIWEEISG